MPVRTLTLDGFRSYEHLEIAFGQGPHVVVGRNAAGKTNLVASIGPAIDGGIVLSGHTDTVPVTGQTWTTDPRG